MAPFGGDPLPVLSLQVVSLPLPRGTLLCFPCCSLVELPLFELKTAVGCIPLGVNLKVWCMSICWDKHSPWSQTVVMRPPIYLSMVLVIFIQLHPKISWENKNPLGISPYRCMLQPSFFSQPQLKPFVRSARRMSGTVGMAWWPAAFWGILSLGGLSGLALGCRPALRSAAIWHRGSTIGLVS